MSERLAQPAPEQRPQESTKTPEGRQRPSAMAERFLRQPNEQTLLQLHALALCTTEEDICRELEALGYNDFSSENFSVTPRTDGKENFYIRITTPKGVIDTHE